MVITKYNNVPVGKNYNLVINQYALSFVEPFSNREIRFGYINNDYSSKGIAIVLIDLLSAVGFSNVKDKLSNIYKAKTIQKQYCPISTSNGNRLMNCVKIDDLSMLLTAIADTKNQSIKFSASRLLLNISNLFALVMDKHAIIEESVSNDLIKQLETQKQEEEMRISARMKFAELPIYEITGTVKC